MSSEFDRKVWEVIRAIPGGRVMTYAEVARALGTTAHRAVGGACARSPGMPDVPCHRVIASDGTLHGFNGGLEKKRALLESEGHQMRPAKRGSIVDYRVVR
jgi:O-6-methylguanine DNA methyltransferase